MMKKVFLAIDIETTGQHYTKNAIIEIGATVMDSERELSTFHGFLTMDGRAFEKRCYDEFWSQHLDKIAEIQEKASHPTTTMENFCNWFDCMCLAYPNLVVLSDFAEYDLGWLNYYISNYTSRPCLYYHTTTDGYSFTLPIDTHSAYQAALAILQPGSDHKWNLEKALEIQNNQFSNNHNSLEDACNIAANYIIFLQKYSTK